MITAVTLRTDQDLTPDNPASVTFHILGTTYRVNDIAVSYTHLDVYKRQVHGLILGNSMDLAYQILTSTGGRKHDFFQEFFTINKKELLAFT